MAKNEEKPRSQKKRMSHPLSHNGTVKEAGEFGQCNFEMGSSTNTQKKLVYIIYPFFLSIVMLKFPEFICQRTHQFGTH